MEDVDRIIPTNAEISTESSESEDQEDSVFSEFEGFSAAEDEVLDSGDDEAEKDQISVASDEVTATPLLDVSHPVAQPGKYVVPWHS
ncbi:hypothetical protein K439DRAFT_1627167 [Ramaria rubella]|nr:hypothetical protein K439DRAFT_1627167 [Ramaria rubella]